MRNEVDMMRRATGGALALLLSWSVLAADRPSYNVTTLAGTPGVAGFHDGPLRLATLNRPTWLDVVTGVSDPYFPPRTGDIYFVDRANQAIRIISSETVSTYTVTYDFLGTKPLPMDFGGPFGGGLLIEPPGGGCGGNDYDRGMFVASSGLNQIPLVSFVGVIAERDGYFILGSGMPGHADSDFRSAQFQTPTGIARSPLYSYDENGIFNRHLYIADTGNHTIRRVRWELSFEACPQPYTIETFAGSPEQPGFADGNGTAARFNTPRGLATATQDGSILVADSGNHVIRRISAAGSVATIIGEPGVAGSNDGPARQAHLNTPSGIDVNARGEIFISDTGNHTIRMLTRDGMLITIAGAPGVAGWADGIGGSSRLAGPVGIRVTPDGSILVADTSNNVIRRLVPIVETHRHIAD
jgi:hypothetical protein